MSIPAHERLRRRSLTAATETTLPEDSFVEVLHGEPMV